MRHHTRPVRARSSRQRSVTRPPWHPTPAVGRTDADPARPGPDLLQRLAVEIRQDLPRVRIEVTGELDLDSAGLLAAMLDHVRSTRHRARGAGEVDVELDLSGVTFADSHGMAPVLQSRTRIVSASEPVRRLLRLLHASAHAGDRVQEHPRPA